VRPHYHSVGDETRRTTFLRETPLISPCLLYFRRTTFLKLCGRRDFRYLSMFSVRSLQSG